MAGYEPTQGRPLLHDWLNRVKNQTKPHYEEAHAIVNKIIAKRNNTANQAKL